MRPSLTLALSLLVIVTAAPALTAGDPPIVDVNDEADLPDANLFDGVPDADLGTEGLQVTLRAAIMHLNFIGDDAEGVLPQINLPAGTYKLKIKGSDEDGAATGDLDIQVPMAIVGAGPDVTTISGAKDRVFEVRSSGFLALSGVTITKGKAVETGEDNGRGGGLRAAGDVDLTDVVITKCAASEDGGGLSVEEGAEATVRRCWFVKNKAGDDGGGVDVSDGELVMTDSTVEGNKAKQEGGGMEFSTATVSLTNVTITKNKGKRGAAINVEFGVTADLLNCTLSFNKAKEDANIGADSPPVDGGPLVIRLENTILYRKGKKGDNCGLPVESLGGNIENGDSCFVVEGNGDLSDTEPLLAKKAENNGGPVRTVALSPGSPAIDFANDGNCPPEDARGQSRYDVPEVGGSTCDCGAYEWVPEMPPKP